MEYNYPVPCPLMGNQKIDMGICFDITHGCMWRSPEADGSRRNLST